MYDILYIIMGFVILLVVVASTLHPAFKIAAILVFLFIGLNYFGLLSFLNPSFNRILSGEIITGCTYDSDCQIKPTTCSACDCGTSVNTFWELSCPLKTVKVENCSSCTLMKPRCMDNNCVSITA